MESFYVIRDFLASLPLWSVLVPPCALFVCALPLLAYRKKRVYLWLSALCLTVGGLLAFGKEFVAPYLLLFCAEILLLYPLFWIRGRTRRKEGREEELYGKFKRELEQPFPEKKEYPPKVCCFEQTGGETAEERGMKLSHVITLLERLKKEKLTPADRLEVEMLSRNVEGSSGRPLTDSQTDDLNDSLSAVLRLVAKYSR